MFNFNDVIENNNSTNIIDNIHHDFLDINVVFFNCYKLLIKAELQDNNWYVITNLVGRYAQTENNRKHLIQHEIFESLLDTEFKYTGMIKNKNDELADIYTSKYFIVTVTKDINSVYPYKTLIKFNDNIDINDLIMYSDICDYNNALNDIQRRGCTDIMSYVRFMRIMKYGHEYTIGDNILDSKFNMYFRQDDLNKLQKNYNDSSIFYMDKTNTKFYFILAPYILRRMTAYSFAELIDYSSAFHLIDNNLSKHETNSEQFVIYKQKGSYPFYLDTKYDYRKINITITDNVHNTTIPDYILNQYINYDDIKKSKTGMNDYRIIIVEPC